MKKILILAALMAFSLPVFAACTITGGACTVSGLPSNVTQTTNLEQIIPNNLQNMARTDAFQRDYRTPYHDAFINTESAVRIEQHDYNANCQFGVCLPGGTMNSDINEIPGE